MMFALMTFFGVLVLGGFTYYIVAEVFGDYYTNMLSLYPGYFLTGEVDFIYNLIAWLPLIIFVIAVVSAIVIELRSRNPNGYFTI